MRLVDRNQQFCVANHHFLFRGGPCRDIPGPCVIQMYVIDHVSFKMFVIDNVQQSSYNLSTNITVYSHPLIGHALSGIVFMGVY